jgi:hypothetical protein
MAEEARRTRPTAAEGIVAKLGIKSHGSPMAGNGRKSREMAVWMLRWPHFDGG